jgi:membrane associated rhomboid family serine protease
MKVTYNSPFILTFTIASIAVLTISSLFPPARSLFSINPNHTLTSPLFYLSSVLYPLGHASFSHLNSNLLLFLLVGPSVEEKYGAKRLVLMSLITAVLTAVIQIFFFKHGLLGASGIVFMLIILSSLTNFKSGEIPITFILVTVIFIGKEIAASFTPDNVSQFAHILGGVCGAFFGLKLGGKH